MSRILVFETFKIIAHGVVILNTNSTQNQQLLLHIHILIAIY